MRLVAPMYLPLLLREIIVEVDCLEVGGLVPNDLSLAYGGLSLQLGMTLVNWLFLIRSRYSRVAQILEPRPFVKPALTADQQFSIELRQSSALRPGGGI